MRTLIKQVEITELEQPGVPLSEAEYYDGTMDITFYVSDVDSDREEATDFSVERFRNANPPVPEWVTDEVLNKHIQDSDLEELKRELYEKYTSINPLCDKQPNYTTPIFYGPSDY